MINILLISRIKKVLPGDCFMRVPDKRRNALDTEKKSYGSFRKAFGKAYERLPYSL
jgi:hypothetical protein